MRVLSALDEPECWFFTGAGTSETESASDPEAILMAEKFGPRQKSQEELR